MRFVFPGFSSTTEFVGGYNGACAWSALLDILHLFDAARWPLTAQALEALVADAKAHGCTLAANGEANIPGVDAYLHHLSVPHTTVGYAQFRLDALHAQLKQLASAKPGDRRAVLIEWSAAGHGLHDDEPGVHYHYSAIGGIDTGAKGDGVGGGYLRGDGDSNTDHHDGTASAPILTPWSAIVAAAPVAYITFPVPQAAPTPVPPAPKPPAPTPQPPAPPPADPIAQKAVATLHELQTALQSPTPENAPAALSALKAMLGEL